jgi:hypothetical protein
MKQNLEAADFRLDPEAVERIEAVLGPAQGHG